MKTPHKHCELIHAWADGAEIEVKALGIGGWQKTTNPLWRGYSEYRVKPEPKPDTVHYYYIHEFGGVACVTTGSNLKLTIDSETGKLKLAEVIS